MPSEQGREFDFEAEAKLDRAEGERAYWEEILVGELWKPCAGGMAGLDRLIVELGSRRLHCAATYVRNAKDDLFTVTRRGEQGIPGDKPAD